MRGMPSRVRSLVVLLALVVPSLALGQPTTRDGFYEVRNLHPAARAGTIPVTRGTRTQHAELGARLTTKTIAIYARDNGNTRFALWARTERRPTCPRAVLRAGPDAVVVESWGGDAEACTLDFELDASQAARVAAALHVPREDRHPIGEQLTGTFAASRRVYRRGEPVEIVLTIANPAGAPSVSRQQGGRQRGLRDNQFAFRITRNGTALAPVEAPDFGGISQRLAVAPSTSGQVRTALAPWGDLGRPGRYSVACSYETELSPTGVDPFTDGHRGEVWDRRFEGTVTFEIR